MSKAALHIEKYGKPKGGSIGHHIDRIEGMEYSYRHADLSKTKDNISLKINELCDMDYNQAIRKRIEQGYNARNKAGKLKSIRKDAVYSLNVMLTGSHQEMKKIEEQGRLNEWIQANLDFCISEFGKENITRFVCHVDEKTPHIHCVFVPITKDGRLAAGDWVGTGKKLESLQTRYAQKMEAFGLKRGVKSDRKHQTTDEYRRREAQKLENAKKLIDKIDNLSKKNILWGLNDVKADLKAGVNALTLKTEEKIEAVKEEYYQDMGRASNTLKDAISIIEGRKVPESKYIPNEEVQEIISNSNLIDYFLHLAHRGQLIFEKKTGKEYIFTDLEKTQKISVSEKGWNDFKSGEGGQIIKAIQKFEGKKWLEAVNWLKEFTGSYTFHYQELRKKTAQEEPNLAENKYLITQVITPSSPKLTNYFLNRGITFETLEKYTKQVHFQVGDKNLYGIALKNKTGGYEIRTPFSKMKFGTSDISEIRGKNASKMIVCEGMTDILSMIEILKVSGRNLDDYSLVCLNSVSNKNKFIEQHGDEKLEILLLLDADEAGDKATKEILNAFEGKNIKDFREYFGILPGENKDLNEHLMKNIKEQEQKKSRGIRR